MEEGEGEQAGETAERDNRLGLMEARDAALIFERTWRRTIKGQNRVLLTLCA